MIIKKVLTGQLKHLERLITDNSPLILTGLGVIGTATTAVLAVQAGMESRKVVEDARYKASVDRVVGGDPIVFTRKEQFAMTWKLYILPVVSFSVTAGCIIGAQKINARRAAAIAGVLALTQEDLRTYKEKVKEKLTGPQYKKVNDEIAEKKAREIFTKEPPIHVPDGEVICIETYTQRQFPSTKNKLEKAENTMNKRIFSGKSGDAICLSDFYDEIGLQHTAISDELGWNTSLPMELEFSSLLTDDGRPVLTFSYVENPLMRPWAAQSF